MWTMVHVFVFSYILHLTVMNSKGGAMDLVKGIFATGFLSTPAMMVMMSPFQLHQLKLKVDWESWAIDFDESQFPGKPDPQAISLCIAFGILACKAHIEGKGARRDRDLRMGEEVVKVSGLDRGLYLLIVAYFVILASVMQVSS